MSVFNDPITTLERAKNKRYGQWGGCPRGRAYATGFCAYEVFPAERGALHHQCRKKATDGPENLYCKVHAARVAESIKRAQAARDAQAAEAAESEDAK